MSVSLSLAAALEKKGIKLVPSTTALKEEGGSGGRQGGDMPGVGT